MYKVKILSKGKIIASVALVFSFCCSANIDAQISGISGGKLIVPDAFTIEKSHFEFEPAFSVFDAKQHFNTNGDLNNLTKDEVSSDVSFRISLGLADNLELGTEFSTGIEDVMIGSKFTAFNHGNTAIALIVGGSFPAGNFTGFDSTQIRTSKYSYSAGVVISNKMENGLSIDAVVSYTKINGQSDYNKFLTYGLSVGYLYTDAFQAIIELNGFTTYNNNFYSKKISFTPGFTYEFSDHLHLVFAVQNDAWGKNELSGTNYVTAFTMCF